MTTHTPGPWAWFPAKAGAVDPTVPHMKFVTGGDGQGLAHTPGLFEPLDTANANLIAAAPELLDAARTMLQEADTFHDDTAHYVEVRRSAVETLRAAIAKAEGR